MGGGRCACGSAVQCGSSERGRKENNFLLQFRILYVEKCKAVLAKIVVAPVAGEDV